MSDYEAIRTEAPPALEDFPSIEDTDSVIRQVNRLFDPYVFFERHKDSIELWCSCCLKHGEIDIPPRTVTTVEYELLYNKHNEHVTCPYCGARATYKNARKLGKKTRLPQYLPVVMLAEKDGDLYARAYWTRKTYATLDGAPEFYLVEGYYFTPGRATMYAQSYSGFKPHSVSGSYDPVHRVVTEPFTEGSYYWFRYKPYVVLGLDAIGKSAFRYCGYESFERGIDAVLGLETVRTRYDMMKFFAAASIYPRQIEMLLKTNCGELVDDLVRGRKKNRDIFDWSKDNYLDAFGLSKTEMRAWRESGAELEAIAWYRRLRRAGLSESFETIKYLDEMCPYTFPMKDFVRLCCRARVKPARLAAYLSQGQKAIPENEIQTYKDYLDMAKALGWDKLTTVGNQSVTINTTADKLFTFSEMEVYGSTSHSYSGEGKQYDYYKAGNSKVKKVGGTASRWWLRSPDAYNSGSFCAVFTDGSIFITSASESCGVCFGFCF